jgi:prepilin signal peptidase PulO-like enzyme (type II secretory pathway)
MSEPVQVRGEVRTTGFSLPEQHASNRAPTIAWLPTWIILLSLSALVASILAITAGHRTTGYFTSTLCTAICILAALFDAWTARIPNPLTYTAILLGLAINAAASLSAHFGATTAVTWLGAPGSQQSAAGFLVCAIIFVLGIVFRVGGGDLKLFVALGALLGLSQLVYVSFVALSVAVVYSLINLLILGQLNAFARIVSLRLLELFYFHRLETFDPDTKPLPKRLVPMGVPFAIGLILSQIVDLKIVFGGGL